MGIYSTKRKNIKNEVTYIKERDTMVITKNNGNSIYVTQVGNIVLCTVKNVKVKGNIFIPYCAKFITESDCHQKWIHLIGKMCTKDNNSKYFKNYKLEEHIINGNGDLPKNESFIIEVQGIANGLHSVI